MPGGENSTYKYSRKRLREIAQFWTALPEGERLRLTECFRVMKQRKNMHPLAASKQFSRILEAETRRNGSMSLGITGGDRTR